MGQEVEGAEQAGRTTRRRVFWLVALALASLLFLAAFGALVYGFAVSSVSRRPATQESVGTTTAPPTPGSELVIIPDFSGVIASPEDIQARYEAAGLAIGLIKWELSDAPFGSVIRVSPAPGTAVPKWTSINITFADAPMEDEWAGDYPDLSGSDDPVALPEVQPQPVVPQPPPNQPPVAAFSGTGDKTQYTQYRLTISAAASSDDRGIVSYAWGIQGPNGEYLEFTGVSFDHYFPWQPQVVALIVRDADGSSDSADTWISWGGRQDGMLGAKATIAAH